MIRVFVVLFKASVDSAVVLYCRGYIHLVQCVAVYGSAIEVLIPLIFR